MFFSEEGKEETYQFCILHLIPQRINHFSLFHVWFSTSYRALIFVCLHMRVVNAPRSNARRSLSCSFCREVVWGPFSMKASGAEFALRYLGCFWAPQLSSRRLNPRLGHELLRGMPGFRAGWVDLTGDFMLQNIFSPVKCKWIPFIVTVPCKGLNFWGVSKEEPEEAALVV